MLTPGKILTAEYKVNPMFMHKLDFYFKDQLKRDKLALLCQDRRIGYKTWKSIFYREIIYLYRFIASRMIMQHKSDSVFVSDAIKYNEVLSLLPHHGIAVHLLRRALPFAMCGLPVNVGFPENLLEEGCQVTEILSKVFCLDDLLFCKAKSSAQKAEAIAANKNCLVLVTGKKRTVERIQNQVKGKVYGITGRCALILTRNVEILYKTYNLLKTHNFTGSCTKLKAAFYIDPSNEIWDIKMKKSYGPAESMERIDLLNPSFIYYVDEKPNIPEFIRGYRVIKSDSKGLISTLIGFGSDPAFKWPGDFLI